MSHSQTLKKYSFLATLLCIVMTQVVAAPPRPINYQGYLAQPDGTPIDTSVGMAVELWTAVTAGTLLYSETHASVAVSEGRFSIEIGTGTPVSGSYDASHFQQESWLALTINGELLSPRTRLGAVAAAQHSETAEGLSTACANGEWLGYRDNVLACYACSDGDSNVCYGGTPGTQNVGECKTGINACFDGAYDTACPGQVIPVGETCNNKDDDCNGMTDDGTSLPGCTTNQYYDNDGDGFGDSINASAECLCSSLPNTSSVGGDCNDADSDINPDAGFFLTLSSEGTFDYNCDSTIEMQYNNPLATCTYNGSSCDYTAGFSGTVYPVCGESRAFANGCSQNGTECTVTAGFVAINMGCR